MKLQNFGKKLEKLRERSGWSVRETARRFNVVSDTTYGRWESGLAQPSIAEAASLAEFWGVSLGWLANDSSDWPPSAPEVTADEDTALGFYRELRDAYGASTVLKELAKLTAEASTTESVESSTHITADHVSRLRAPDVLREETIPKPRVQRLKKRSEKNSPGKDEGTEGAGVPVRRR